MIKHTYHRTATAFLALTLVGMTSAQAAVLYNNSNITTGTGNGFNGANTSSIAAVDSTYGFTSNSVTLTYQLAEDFSLSTGSAVNLVTFDAYSTSTYPTNPTSPFTGATVSIWNAQPGTAGAAILFTSSTLATTSWTGVYRVTSTTLTNAQRPVFTLGVSFANVSLPAGTYWASFDVTSLTTPGNTASVFTPPLMNADGTQPAGNGIQSADGGATWVASADTSSGASNRFPLAVAGNAVPEPSTWALLTGTVVLFAATMLRRQGSRAV